jgi:hypothetical protein
MKRAVGSKHIAHPSGVEGHLVSMALETRLARTAVHTGPVDVRPRSRRVPRLFMHLALVEPWPASCSWGDRSVNGPRQGEHHEQHNSDGTRRGSGGDGEPGTAGAGLRGGARRLEVPRPDPPAGRLRPGHRGDARGGHHRRPVRGGGFEHRVAGLGGGGADYASFYEFTRQITDGVDTGTFQIVSAIAAVKSYPPSSVDDTKAVWGPGGDALDPVNWKVMVTQVGSGEFDYEVDGRPHGSTSDADFKAIVTGHGYGKTHPSYRSGQLTVYGDVLAALDPTQSSGVTASQCWSATFAQSYYTDSVGYQPTAGDAAACVFAQAQFKQ